MQQPCLLCPAIFRSLKIVCQARRNKGMQGLGLAWPLHEHSSGDVLLTPRGHLLMSRREKGPSVQAPLAA